MPYPLSFIIYLEKGLANNFEAEKMARIGLNRSQLQVVAADPKDDPRRSTKLFAGSPLVSQRMFTRLL